MTDDGVVELGCGDKAHALDPEGPPTAMAPALVLARQDVERAFAPGNGSLAIAFADGHLPRVPFGDHHEAWSSKSPRGKPFVSTPGEASASDTGQEAPLPADEEAL